MIDRLKSIVLLYECVATKGWLYRLAIFGQQASVVLIAFRLPSKSSLHFHFRVQAAFGYIHISRFFKVFLLTACRLCLLEILLCSIKKGCVIRPKLLGKRFNRCRHKRFAPAFFRDSLWFGACRQNHIWPGLLPHQKSMLGHLAIHARIVSQFGGKFMHHPRRVHRQLQRIEIHSAGFPRFFAVSGCSGTPKPFGSIPIFVVFPADSPHFKNSTEFGQQCGLPILQSAVGQIDIMLCRLMGRNLRWLAISLREQLPFQI